MSTDARGLERADASMRPAASWQSESASEPMIRRRYASAATFARLRAMRTVSVASKARISIVVLRPHAAERLAVQRRALAAPRDPLLARAEVVDVAEVDVAHRLARRRRRSRRRRTGCRASRSASRRSGRRPRPSLPSPSRADLLADDRHRRGRGSARRSRPRPPCRSPSCRRRPRPGPTTGSRSARVGSSASTAARPRRTRGRRASQSVIDGRKSRPARQLRDRRTSIFCGIRRRARATSQTSSSGVGRSRNAASASPRSTAASASSRDAV